MLIYSPGVCISDLNKQASLEIYLCDISKILNLKLTKLNLLSVSNMPTYNETGHMVCHVPSHQA